jgi:hypothetical protein
MGSLMTRRILLVAASLWVLMLIAGIGSSVLERRTAAGAERPVESRLRSLRDLYEGGRLELLLAECAADRARDGTSMDPRVEYLEWAAHRRMNRPEEAQRILAGFRSRHPSHPLGAEMCFATGLDALVAGDVAEARRALEGVAADYPGSTAAAKVSKMKDRLASLAPAANEPVQ